MLPEIGYRQWSRQFRSTADAAECSLGQNCSVAGILLFTTGLLLAGVATLRRAVAIRQASHPGEKGMVDVVTGLVPRCASAGVGWG
jgi:hypothetical protein